MQYIYYKDTIIGKIGIAEQSNHITNVYFERSKFNGNFLIAETPIIKNAFHQLDQYLNGERKEFDLPLNPDGTEFMCQVWDSLLSIPYGQTKSYKEIATEVNRPNAQRAVGLANNKNPIPIFIPCHRVIGKSGKLIGYAGGIDIKKQLLELEKQYADL